MNRYRARGLVVMIVACQVIDPGSIPGERTLFAICRCRFGFFCSRWLAASLVVGRY